MIHHTVAQGSTEWHELRATIPTASQFDRIITPAKWEPTKGETRRNFQLELLANRIFGLPAELPGISALEHGREWEPIARAAYEFERGVEIADGGFWTDDQMTYGASPDGLVGLDGLVEFKNPESPKVHLAALIDSLEYSARAELVQNWTACVISGSEVTGFLRDHWAQVQGQLFVTGRKWCDLVCNFARLPMVVVRVYANPDYHAILRSALADFCTSLAILTQEARIRGWYREPQPVVVEDRLGITDADVDQIVASIYGKQQEATW